MSIKYKGRPQEISNISIDKIIQDVIDSGASDYEVGQLLLFSKILLELVELNNEIRSLDNTIGGL